MNKKVCCTCEVVVLLIKPIVFLTFYMSSASLDLKLPKLYKRPVSIDRRNFSFFKALRLRQLRVKLISRVVKEFSDYFFPGER